MAESKYNKNLLSGERDSGKALKSSGDEVDKNKKDTEESARVQRGGRPQFFWWRKGMVQVGSTAIKGKVCREAGRERRSLA